jgi:hypothetical protein
MRPAYCHFVTSVLATFLAGLFAPSLCAAEWEWEPVPDSLLAQTRSTLDPGADSEISSTKVTVSEELNGCVLDHRVRVKVFSAEGAAYWRKIVIYGSESSVKIGRFEARTILPDGTVLEVAGTKASREVALDERHHRLFRWAFAPRGVCAGCVLEYRYREERTGARGLTDYYPLQFDVPVREVNYELTPPIKLVPVPLRYVTFNSRPKILGNEVHKNRYEFIASDVPAFRPEPDMLPEMTERAGVLVYYAAGNRHPADFWPPVGKSLAESFEALSRPDHAARGIVRDSLPEGSTPTEGTRLQAILEWCRNRIRVVPDDRDSLSRLRLNGDADGSEVVRARAGTARGINLAFAALCRAAGFEVRCLKAASHEDVFFDQNWMSPAFLPAQETAVKVGGTWVSFSPQSRYLPWDMLPAEEEGDYALLCDKDSTCFIINPSSPPGASVLARTCELTLQPDGTLAGQLLLAFTGHFNDRIRSELEPGDETLEEVVRRQGLWDAAEAEVTQIESPNLQRLGEPLRVTANVRIRNHAVPGARRTLLEPAVMRAHMPPKFKAVARTFPVYFEFAYAELDTIRIHPGSAWRLEQAERLRTIAAGGLGRYQASVDSDSSGSTISFVRAMSIATDGKLMYPVSAYEDLRNFFDAVQKRDRVTLSLVPAPGVKP